MNLINYIVKHIDSNNIDNDQYSYLYFTLCGSSKNSNSKKINSVFNLIYNNIFISEKTKEFLIKLFNKAQKIYWGFTKLALIWKYKKIKKFDNNETLYGVQFDSYKKKQRIILIENNTKYEFRINELLKIWKNALEHSSGLVPNPRFPRNPYTGLPFCKSNLYNIYFFAKFNTDINIPSICYLFFHLSFDIQQFCEGFYTQLKDMAIYTYLNESDAEILFYDCINMVRANERLFNCSRFNEHMENKYKKELVCILKHMLRYYLFSTLSHNPFTKKYNKKMFCACVKKFMKLNPTFGRRIFYLSYDESLSTSNFNRFASPIIDLTASDKDDSYHSDDEDDVILGVIGPNNLTSMSEDDDGINMVLPNSTNSSNTETDTSDEEVDVD
jgi:hypothetical protein